MDKILSVADIAAANDCKIEKVPVIEWGGSIYMRTLTVSEVESISKKKIIPNSVMLAAVICDENGNKIFSDQEVQILEKKNSAVVVRLVEKAIELNGMGDAAKVIEDDAKN